MNFKKGFGKAQRPAPPNPSPAQAKGAGVSLSGFSFKKLEEDEDEEDLTSYTGKYEKIVEQSQKAQAQKRDHERSMSTSSISSTSSGQEESKPEKNSWASQPELDAKHQNIHVSSRLPEGTGSPLRSAARQRIETSKELFSGLKGKIAGKISKTIDEFSGDTSTILSPEKEKSKSFPTNESDGFEIVVKETVPFLHGAPPENVKPETQRKNGSVEHESSLDKPKPEPTTDDMDLFKMESSTSGRLSFSESECGTTSHVPSEASNASNLQSENVDKHPLANFDGDDDFEDVIEPSNPKSEENTQGDDSSEHHDSKSTGSNAADILMFVEHFNSETACAASSPAGLSTSTKVKSRSVIKRLGKKDPKTIAVATMSALHDKPDEEIIAFEGSIKGSLAPSKEVPEQKKHPASLNIPDSPYPSQSTLTSSLSALPFDLRSLPYQKLVAVVVVLFAYLIVPLPSYMSGLLMGLLLASLGWGLYMWLMEPPKPEEPFTLPPLEEAPPVPQMKITTEAEEFTYKGWLNELTEYNVEEYHINKTHSVFVSLEGSHLRIQRPKNPVSRRAMWDEVLPKAQFIHQRHFDLPGASVYLAPNALVKKRIWSKKYPICIDLSGGKHAGDSGASMKHISSDPNMSDKKDKSHVHGFEVVTEDKCENKILYLFARTGREKEEWFRRFAAAAQGKPLGNHVLEMRRVINMWSPTVLRKKRDVSAESLSSTMSESHVDQAQSKELEGYKGFQTKEDDLLHFAHYMGRLMPTGSLSKASSPVHNAASQQKDLSKVSTPVKEGGQPVTSSPGKEGEETHVNSPRSALICNGQLFWVNALIGRCFFDFLRDKRWIGKVTEKLQRKLSKIHVPYFIEELQVTDIHMGYEIPAIRNAGKPYIDERGFWVDLDITYSGGFTMTIETKMNLMKLKKSSHQSQSVGHSVDGSKSAITHSDEEDSAESSTDEEEETPPPGEESTGGGGGSGKKFFRYLNKITQSKYFQQATEYGVIKRAMENVSNTPLTLTVTVNSLVGKLALNIPPPRSDRLWYGFRGNPLLRLSAKPQVGERAVKITHVTDWIEKKLAIEFQRVFVMPNMDDLVIPILVPGEVSGTGISHSTSL